MIRGTRRPGGAGRTRGGRSSGGKGAKGGGGKIGFWAEVFGCGVLVFVGAGLVLGSALSLGLLAVIVR